MGTLGFRYRAAAVLMIVHGAVMEFGVFLALFPLLALGVDLDAVGEYFSFNVPFFSGLRGPGALADCALRHPFPCVAP
jgi:hypothetical protein